MAGGKRIRPWFVDWAHRAAGGETDLRLLQPAGNAAPAIDRTDRTGGYLLGSFPSARLVAGRRGVNPLTAGEANPGAVNVWRLLGPRLGEAVLAADIGKGALAGLFGLLLGGWWAACAGVVLAMAGHAGPRLATLVQVPRRTCGRLPDRRGPGPRAAAVRARIGAFRGPGPARRTLAVGRDGTARLSAALRSPRPQPPSTDRPWLRLPGARCRLDGVSQAARES